MAPAGTLLVDHGYDANWFRDALTERGTTPCIPSRKARKVAIPHDATLYKQRHRIETAMSRLKRLGERLSARDPARQVAEVQIRCAILNTFNALGMPNTIARA
ncbi:transposase [Muricoccus radiodurans]|uniref:transposase n=1 Tax=Muricoccus radiodurans TaxID=2231721 RepID=UPI003CE7B188